MKKIVSSLLFTAFFTAQAAEEAAPVPAQEEYKPWSLVLDSGVHSHYWWRGLTLNPDPVNQNAVTFEYALDKEGDLGTIGLNYWNNVDLTQVTGNAGDITENDWGVYWYKGLGDLGTLKLGAVYYDYPAAAALGENYFSHSAEAYAIFTANCFLKPELSVWYDFQKSDGLYVSFGLSHSVPLESVADFAKDWSLDLSSVVGWNSGKNMKAYYGEVEEDASFTDFNLKAGLTIPMCKTESMSMALEPYIQWFTTLDRYYGNAGVNQDGFVGGVNLSVTF
ncbi:MAG: hypothetical protein RL095_117 [Verrucomicrobiota bacterium]|jgi:hypothetical protein